MAQELVAEEAQALDSLASWLETAWPGTPEGVAAVLATAITRASGAVGARGGRIIFADDPGWNWLAEESDPEAGELTFRLVQGFYRARQRPAGPVMQALTSGQPVYGSDLRAPAPLDPSPHLVAAGILACACVPLPGDSGTVGVLDLHFDRPFDLSPAARAALVRFAPTLGSTLAHVRR
jgi:GAF domain-containing protein